MRGSPCVLFLAQLFLFPFSMFFLLGGMPGADVGVKAQEKAKGAFGHIPARMLEFVKEHKISGAVTLVAHKGKVVHVAAVGKADIENNIPMRSDSIFAIASMTKPITATALMILVDEKKVALDDPVAKYIPAFGNVKLRNGQKPKQTMTIRHLMTHTSGLAGSQRNEGSLENTVVELAKRPLLFEPGTRWQYSPGLTVCGRIIEIVAKQPYEQFLEERIFQPLKMKDTTFFPTKEQQKRVVSLYRPGKEKSLQATTHWISELSDKRTPNPSAGLFSTAADLANFYQMVLHDGEWNGKRILSKEAVSQMTRVQTGELQTGFTPGNGWGLGWCVVRKPEGVTGMLSPGTFGHGGAFGTQGWVDPRKKAIYVLLIQRTGFGNSDASAIRAAFQELAAKALDD
ncbi:MAG: serine hydrolase [Gemmatales bacterium]|nr:MAG: serine hydrolase [Gemmatales bacterium]